jgi:mannose-6-phosphate isomerase-like protein (cupin superfamily)
MATTNLEAGFSRVDGYFSPKVIAQVNDSYVKVAKLRGQLAWHKHDDEDELFWVFKGRLRIEYEAGRTVELGPGEMHVVPRNTLHNPVAEEECWVVLIEPATTKHTGDAITEHTKSIEQQLE